MAMVTLAQHDQKYASRMFELCSAPQVKDALGLSDESFEDTRRFIDWILAEERAGKQYSRVILDESQQLIGVTTLMSLNDNKKTCHLGTWIGHDYWGMGYNQASKVKVLNIAFFELNLDVVFTGARITNVRSQKAQEKLPFIRLHVKSEFPDEHAFLEEKEQSPCVLHAFFRDDFVHYLDTLQSK